MNKVLAFGTFDGVHEGHRVMLREAKALGDYLIAAVAPDLVVKEIKGAFPRSNAAQRITALKTEHLADEVILGDGELHGWEIISRVKPDIIALGYDQDNLRVSLERHFEISYPDIETEEGFQTNPKKPIITVLKPHHPERYKSSLL